MDKLVGRDNQNIIASGELDIPVPYGVLKTGSFEGSSGAPEDAKPGQFRMKMYWSQSTIDGVYDRTLVIADMYFYHKWEWYSNVYGNGNTHVTINGNRSTLGSTVNVDGGGGEYKIMSHRVEVPTSSSSITISGRCDIGQSFDSPVWYGVEGSSSISLINPTPPIPPVPPTATISGRYEKGHTTNISFTGAGSPTGYKIYYRVWRKVGDVYSQWYYLNTGSTNTSGYYELLHDGGARDWDSIQMGVTAYSAGGESARRETGWIYHQGVSAYNGSSYVKGQLRVWNGSSWVQGYMKVWDGGSWVNSQ